MFSKHRWSPPHRLQLASQNWISTWLIANEYFFPSFSFVERAELMINRFSGNQISVIVNTTIVSVLIENLLMTNMTLTTDLRLKQPQSKGTWSSAKCCNKILTQMQRRTKRKKLQWINFHNSHARRFYDNAISFCWMLNEKKFQNCKRHKILISDKFRMETCNLPEPNW